MSGASDIAKLFAVAGGSAAQYQEVERAEQLEGARGRWSAHADTDPDLAAQGEDALDASQPLISWSIAAVTDEPPPVVHVTQQSPAIQAANQAAVEAPVETQVQPAVQAVVEPSIEPIAEPAALATPEPTEAAPQPAALRSVFARLMERNEPRADARADTAPRGKS